MFFTLELSFLKEGIMINFLWRVFIVKRIETVVIVIEYLALHIWLYPFHLVISVEYSYRSSSTMLEIAHASILIAICINGLQLPSALQCNIHCKFPRFVHLPKSVGLDFSIRPAVIKRPHRHSVLMEYHWFKLRTITRGLESWNCAFITRISL